MSSASRAPPGGRWTSLEAPTVPLAAPASDQADGSGSAGSPRPTPRAALAALHLAWWVTALAVLAVFGYFLDNIATALAVVDDGGVARPALAGVSSALVEALWAPAVQVGRRVVIVLSSVPMALFVFAKRRREGVALLFSLLILSSSVSPIAILLMEARASFPAMDLWRWPLLWSFTIMPIAGFGMLLLFPDGRFWPPWSRVLVAPAIVLSLGYPSMWLASGSFSMVLFAVNLAAVALFILCQVHRYRHNATPLERHQIKWFLAAIVFFLGCQVVAMTVFNPLCASASPVLATLGVVLREATLLAAFLGSNLLFLFAGARYRVWDIDVVINRSLVYAGLALLLGGAFLVAFVALGALTGALLGAAEETWGLVASTALAVALFRPVHRLCRRVVDRHLFGIGVDYDAAPRATPDRALRPARPEERAASRSFDDFEDLRFVGRGGMGEVYRARHPGLRRDVAIKTLTGAGDLDEGVRRRFVREAEVVASLRHPNIVVVHDFGEREGDLFMVMEFIDGEDLSVLLARRGRLPLDEALPVLEDVARALDHAHAAGVVHRDVKPSNVMIERADSREGLGRAVLMDFGIARAEAAKTQLTRPGDVIGTLEYIAPEQVGGCENVDGRADVYSLTVMAYRMLAGRLPFHEARAIALAMAHLQRSPEDPRRHEPSLPAGVARALLRGLEKRPEDRYGSAGDLVAAMREAVEAAPSARVGR